MGLIEHVPVLPHQGELLESRHHTKASPGGLGSGKSKLVVMGAVAVGEENGWVAPSLVIEPSFPMIRDIIVPAFEEFAEEWDFYAVWKQEAQHILCDLGDGRRFKVLLRSGEHPNSVVGVNAGAVFIDEAGGQKSQLIKKAIARARHPKAKRREVWLVGTPEKLEGEFYDICEGGTDEERHLVRAKTTANFFLKPTPEEYIRQRYGRFSPQERQMYMDGEFVARHGRVYTYYDPELHEANCDDPLDGQLVMSCDWGHNTMPWSFGRVKTDERGREHGHIWGEVVGRQTDTFKQLERTKEYLRQFFYEASGEDWPWTKIARSFTVYCDAMGASSKSGHQASETDLELLRAEGFVNFRYPERNPKVSDRVYTVQHRLREKLLKFDTRAGRAPYHARCLRHHEYGLDGRPLKSKDDGTGEPGLDHGADDIGYLCWERWEFRAPRGNVGYRRT